MITFGLLFSEAQQLRTPSMLLHGRFLSKTTMLLSIVWQNCIAFVFVFLTFTFELLPKLFEIIILLSVG